MRCHVLRRYEAKLYLGLSDNVGLAGLWRGAGRHEEVIPNEPWALPRRECAAKAPRTRVMGAEVAVRDPVSTASM